MCDESDREPFIGKTGRVATAMVVFFVVDDNNVRLWRTVGLLFPADAARRVLAIIAGWVNLLRKCLASDGGLCSFFDHAETFAR